MGRTSQMLMENRKILDAYLKIFDYIDGYSIKVKDLNHAVDLAQNIDRLKKEKAQLEFDIDMLMDKKSITRQNWMKSKKCITKPVKFMIVMEQGVFVLLS
jgi:hypothetical protein